ncbi:hypothetical protein ACJX0J_007229, partial [Zea mays]
NSFIHMELSTHVNFYHLFSINRQIMKYFHDVFIFVFDFWTEIANSVFITLHNFLLYNIINMIYNLYIYKIFGFILFEIAHDPKIHGF